MCKWSCALPFSGYRHEYGPLGASLLNVVPIIYVLGEG